MLMGLIFSKIITMTKVIKKVNVKRPYRTSQLASKEFNKTKLP